MESCQIGTTIWTRPGYSCTQLDKRGAVAFNEARIRCQKATPGFTSTSVPYFSYSKRIFPACASASINPMRMPGSVATIITRIQWLSMIAE